MLTNREMCVIRFTRSAATGRRRIFTVAEAGGERENKGSRHVCVKWLRLRSNRGSVSIHTSLIQAMPQPQSQPEVSRTEQRAS